MPQPQEHRERNTAQDLRARETDSIPRLRRGRRAGADTSRTTRIFFRAAHRRAEPPVPVGSTFATKYHLERLLGRGAMGAVYLARDVALERHVAVKILLPAHAAQPRIVDAFHREAVAMASVRHPNVVQIYTAGEHEGLLFLVMEYVPGRAVAALIRERFGSGHNIALRPLLGIVEQAAQGLAAMHRQGIVHGDVKPANILIAEDDHVAITDFGLVASSVSEPVGGEPVTASYQRLSGGTPLYIAPELIVGHSVLPAERHLCDVYSFSASVFEMFTGRGPFQGATVEDLLDAHLFAPPPRLTLLRPDLPAALDAVLRRGLSKRPQKRYPSCVELAAAVRAAVRRGGA